MLPSYKKKNLRLSNKKTEKTAGKEPSDQHSPFSGILSLQKSAGNRAVGQLFLVSSPRPENPIGSLFSASTDPNTRIPVNSPGDKHEREAERAEKQVMSAKQPEVFGSTRSENSDTDHGESPGSAVALRSPLPSSGNGKKLHPEDRQFFEDRFGWDFGGVRVHSDRAAAASAGSLSSRAYTLGGNITFGAEEYRPRTREGRRLIAHELAHVVQQTRGRGVRAESGLASTLSPALSQQAQRTMIATGDSAGFAALANSIIAVQYEVAVSRAGVVSIRSTNIQGPPTRAAQELVATLRRVINDTNTTTVEFIHGATSRRASDRAVLVGSYAQGKIDLDDITQFGSGEGISDASTLIHEIQEQYRKQVHGEAYGTAHASGISAEERAAGATRGASTSRTISATTIEITVPYTYPDGRIVDVTFRVTNGNVTSVSRRTRRTP